MDKLSNGYCIHLPGNQHYYYGYRFNAGYYNPYLYHSFRLSCNMDIYS